MQDRAVFALAFVLCTIMAFAVEAAPQPPAPDLPLSTRTASADPAQEEDPRDIVLNDDGGWSDFQDERAVVVGNRLFAGSVAMGSHEPARRGDVDVVCLDLSSRRVSRRVLEPGFEADEGASPALLAFPDGRLLAMYTQAGADSAIHVRRSMTPLRALSWEPVRITVPDSGGPIAEPNLAGLWRDGWRGGAYALVQNLEEEGGPAWLFSGDRGLTWTMGGLLIDVPDSSSVRPHVKCVSDKRSRLHFAFTIAGPNGNTSLYHALLDGGTLRRANGGLIRKLREGPMLPFEGVCLFPATPDSSARIHDIAMDRNGTVRIAYSVQRDIRRSRTSMRTGPEHRYHWAQWDGRVWWNLEVASAGAPINTADDEAGEAGGMCLHPDDPNVVVISTNVNPMDGTPLPGGHHELFRGRKPSRAFTWKWEALTPRASNDHLRPHIPAWRRGRTLLVWLRGTHRSSTDYDLDVVARIER